MISTFIYFIFDPRQKAVKIGKTDRPLARLVELREQYGEQLTPLLWLIRPSTFEPQLHRHFAAYHLNGEWFAYSDPIRQYISDRLAELSVSNEQALPRLLLEENRHRIVAELHRLWALLERIRRSGAFRTQRHPEFEKAVGTLMRGVDHFEEDFIKAQTQLSVQEEEILRLQTELEILKKAQQVSVECTVQRD